MAALQGWRLRREGHGHVGAHHVILCQILFALDLPSGSLARAAAGVSALA